MTQLDTLTALHALLSGLLAAIGSVSTELMLAEKGVAGSYTQTIQQALDAMQSSKERAKQKGRWAFTGDEAKLVMRACAIYDEQNSRATRGRIVAALAEMKRRVEEVEAA